MVYEDFTTFTEVDAEDTVTIVSSTEISGLPLDRDMDSYVYKDYNANHFGDFEHLIDAEESLGDSTVHGAYYGFWGVSNDIDDFHGWTTGFQGWLNYDSVSGKIKVYIHNKHNGSKDGWLAGALNTRYYFTCSRNNTTGSIKIYSDSARTSLLDTVTEVVPVTTYRYAYGCGSRNTGSSNFNFYGRSFNLDLQEITYHTPSDNAKAADSIVFNAGYKQSDNPKANDSLSVSAQIPLSGNPKSSDGLAFDAGKNISDNPKASDTLIHAAGVFLSDTAKTSDIISFVKNMAHAVADTAKASDIIAFILPGHAFKHPIKIFKDVLQKYTKENGKKYKYRVIEDKKFKYVIEKD